MEACISSHFYDHGENKNPKFSSCKNRMFSVCTQYVAGTQFA